LMPFLTGQNSAAPHETFYWRQGPRAALRHGDWKLVGQGAGAQKKWELYNIARDIAEADDRAKAEPEKLSELQKLWEQSNAQMREPFFGGR